MREFYNQLEGRFEPHEVDGIGSNADEENLHDEEIERLPSQKQIDIACEEDDQVNLLRFIGQSCMKHLVPKTLRLAKIFSTNMSIATRCRKSPMS